jgi:hypothetical protein
MGSIEAMLLIAGGTAALLCLVLRLPQGKRRPRVRP